MAIPRFWREIDSRYNLVGTRCGNCGDIDFPPRSVCPKCGRKSLGKMERLQLSGHGTVVSYTVVHDAPSGFEAIRPYSLAIIELEEGARLTSQVIDCDPAEIGIGMPVEAVFRKLGEEGESGIIHYGYKFRPSGKAPPVEDQD
ncbi:MAG: Zn-ribbon domain-containing OB-fold protein [Thermoplasmata archaeon]